MKLKTSFFVVFALALASLFLFTAPLNAQAKTENNMHIFLIGSSGIGLQQLARVAAAFDAPILIVQPDGDGRVIREPEMPIIALRDRLLATATRLPDISPPKTNTRQRVNHYRIRKFYDVPPNDYGYRGISFSNPTRASPSAS